MDHSPGYRRDNKKVCTIFSPFPLRRYLLLVIFIAFALRVIQLDSLPFSLNLDEATNGLDALQLFRLGWIIPFLQNNFGRETLFFYLQALALWLYGISFFSLRFASVLAATATIPLLYAVGRRLQMDDLCFFKTGQAQAKHIPALLAATGLAVSYWHVYFSRMGLRAILLPPLLLGLVWCFWQGRYAPTRRGSRRLWLIGAGIILGITFYTYLAARLLPFLFIAFLLIELMKRPRAYKKRVTDIIIFGLSATLVVIPLGLYFFQNPQAFTGRIQAISILAGADPINVLAGNLTSLLRLHFLGGTWLGQWPALNLLSAIGLVVGLIVCFYHLNKPTALFLLLWAAIGTMPVLFSAQDWAGQTTILRGIIAWPALFLISAVGLVVLVNMFIKAMDKLAIKHAATRPIAVFWLLLIVGSLTTSYHYFFIWATTHNIFSDHPRYMARYLNSQTTQLTLTPLRFYTETVTNLLLQAQYPTLTNIEADELHSLFNSPSSAVYLLPHKSTTTTGFVLLKPSPNSQGIAYLLPPLTAPQIEALSTYSANMSPLGTVFDAEQEPIAHIYSLPTDAQFLPIIGNGEPNKLALKPPQATFNQNVRLTDYWVEPTTIKPGETISLTLKWQIQKPLDGDYYLFIHLFDVSQRQRYGQINTPLTGILFDAHRWPVGLTVPDKHTFFLPADAVEGAYRFEVGLYHASSLQRLPVSIGAPQLAPSIDDKVILGKFHVRQKPLPAPQYHLTNLEFDHDIALIGLDLPSNSLRAGQSLTYSLYWQALAPISQDYTVFTHLLDMEGNLRAQLDNMPQQGHYPTSWWDDSETVIDPYSLSLPSDLEPGQYRLRVGLYLPETGQRLHLKNEVKDFVDLPTSITIQN